MRIKEAGAEVEIITLGKKASSTLRFLGIEPSAGEVGVMDAPRYDQAQGIIEPLMDRYISGDIDRVEVVYSRFISAARQYPDTVSVLPAGGSR